MNYKIRLVINKTIIKINYSLTIINKKMDRFYNNLDKDKEQNHFRRKINMYLCKI